MVRKRSNDDRVLTAQYIRKNRQARQNGIERTTRLHNYQCEVLIVCAWNFVMSNPLNKELVDVVSALYKTYQNGYFDDSK